jgi:hypothetical protein
MKAARGLRAGMTAMALGAMLGGAAMAQDDVSCELVPLELPLFGGTPVAVFATPSSQASPAAGSLNEDEARDILEMYAACTNTGDPTLVWAMFTPRWFSQTFADPEEHYLPAFEQMLDQDSAPTGAPLQLVEVIEIEPREGMVDVTATFRSGDQEWTDRLTLAQVDGQWLIDEVELIDPASETREKSPPRPSPCRWLVAERGHPVEVTAVRRRLLRRGCDRQRHRLSLVAIPDQRPQQMDELVVAKVTGEPDRNVRQAADGLQFGAGGRAIDSGELGPTTEVAATGADPAGGDGVALRDRQQAQHGAKRCKEPPWAGKVHGHQHQGDAGDHGVGQGMPLYSREER